MSSRYLIVDFLPNRKHLAARLDRILTLIKKFHGHTPQLFHTDNAKEYLAKETKRIFVTHGVTSSKSLPYSPQENGIAERINSTIMSTARASLYHSKLSDGHWEDAVRDAAYKYNITVHSGTQKLPYTMWYGHPPRNPVLHIFGSLGTIPVFVDRTRISKLDPRCHDARYLYPQDDKHVMTYNITTDSYQLVRPQDFVPYHRSTDPVATTSTSFKAYSRHSTPSSITKTTLPPKDVSQARRYPDADEWETAHNKELDQIDARGVVQWIPEEKVPRSVKPLPLKMDYTYKRDSAGNIVKRKARCVLRGDRMIPGLHYDPATTPFYMADKTSIRLLFAIAAAFHLSVEHLDIESAYLHEKYKHDQPVYIRQFPRFDGRFKHPSRLGLLIGNLYCGKNSGNTFLTAAFTYLKLHGYQQCEAEQCLFFKWEGSHLILISLSMDDFLVAASTPSMIDQLCQLLVKKYTLKRLGTPSQFLGWTVTRFPDGAFHISQPNYITNLLHKMRMHTCNGKHSPYLSGIPVHPPNSTDIPIPHSTHLYQTLLGDLRYITDSTRPDIYFIVNRLSTALKCPTQRHWSLLKSLLRYLQHTKHRGVYYPATHRNGNIPPIHSLAQRSVNLLETYADADHASDVTDRKSISGTVQLFNGAPVAWLSKKQSITALSRCEAEYISATTAVQQTFWLRRLLSELKLHGPSPVPISLDNQSSILIAKNNGPTKRRKFIDLRHHYLQHNLKKQAITVRHVPSSDMLADMFTKVLNPLPFNNMLSQLNIIDTNRASATSLQRLSWRPGACQVSPKTHNLSPSDPSPIKYLPKDKYPYY